MVVIDVGTNDLADRDFSPQLLLDTIFIIAKRLVNNLQVKSIVVLQVRHRSTHGRFSLPQWFCHKADQYNKLLSSLAISCKYCEPTFPLTYWFHKGLRTNQSSYIADGVHLNRAGLHKYIRNIINSYMLNLFHAFLSPGNMSVPASLKIS